MRHILATSPVMAVVRIAAKNVLSERAPKYLLSFVLPNFVQARIPFMKSPGSSSFQGCLEDGSCDQDNMGPTASPWPSSPSSVPPLMIHFPSIMRIFQVMHQQELPVLTILPLRNPPIEMLIHLLAIP